MDAALDEEPRSGDARLAGRGEDARDHTLDRVLDLGVVEHDVRRFAAELEADALHAARRRLVDLLSCEVGAGERHLGDERMLDQRRARFRTEAGDDVDDTGRKAGFLDETHELERARGGVLRRLDDHRVAGRERRRQLPRQQQERRVPRDDRRDDAERLVARVVEGVGFVGGDDRALDLVGEAAEVVVPLRHVRGLRAHLGVELAVVANFDFREVAGTLRDQIAQRAQQRAPARGGHPRPVTGTERRVRRPNRAVDIVGPGAWDGRPGSAGERILRFERRPGGRVRPPAVDVHLIVSEVCGCRHRFSARGGQRVAHESRLRDTDEGHGEAFVLFVPFVNAVRPSWSIAALDYFLSSSANASRATRNESTPAGTPQ